MPKREYTSAEKNGIIFCLCYFLWLGTVAVILSLRWPIHAPDTDLWYHLNSARYFFETGLMGNDTFYSFIDPPRTAANYFWGFQTIVYAVFREWDYTGLILLRTLLFGGTLIGLFAYILIHATKRQPYILAAAIGGLFPIILIARIHLVRPHSITYLMMILFLLILEHKSLWRWALPVLAAFWVNCHGIVYPLMYWITGAYIIEAFIEKFRSQENSSAFIKRTLPLWLVFAAPLATPHAWDLINTPWISTSNASLYISELKPLTFDKLTSIIFNQFGPTKITTFNILIVLGFISAILSLKNRPLRISHAILFLGGVLIFQRGERFLSEAALLFLPIIAHSTLVSKDFLEARFKKRDLAYVLTTLTSVALLLPAGCVFYQNLNLKLPHYPFSRINAPEGVCRFLNTIKIGGNILNYPDSGGYLQWRLYPGYKIFTDMKVPFFFTDYDMFISNHVFVDETVFNAMTNRYTIDCATVPNEIITSKEDDFVLKNHNEFRLVFFDATEGLFCSSVRMPEIVKRYEIKSVPFEDIMTKTEDALFEDMDADTRDKLFVEMNRMLSIDSEGIIPNYLSAKILIMKGDYEKASERAETLIQTFPDNIKGYELAVEASFQEGDFKGVIKTAGQAQQATAQKFSMDEQLAIAASYLAEAQPQKALDFLNSQMHPFQSKALFPQLILLATAADKSGSAVKAEELYSYAHTLYDDVKLSAYERNLLKTIGLNKEQLEALFAPFNSDRSKNNDNY